MRRENASRLFRVGSWEIVAPVAPGTALAPLQTATELAITLGRHMDEQTWRNMARELFAANNSLVNCMLLTDDPARVLVTDRAMTPSSYTPEKRLPGGLPYAAATRVYAAGLLAWELKGDALEALHRAATVPVHPL